MAVTDIFEVSRQGMQANRTALQTTSNNIANANSPGYSRQRAIIQTRADKIAGTNAGGVELKGVMRVHDAFVAKQIVEESHGLGDYRSRSEALTRLENLFSREGKELGELMNGFFNDMRELSLNPETSTVREVVSSSAKALALGFHRASDSLDGMRRDLDLRIEDAVLQVNMMTKELGGLNETIMIAESRGDTPNDLYDRQEVLLKQLGEKVDFQSSVDQFGMRTIIAGGHALVHGPDSNELYTMRTPANGEKAEGGTDIYVRNAHGSGRLASRSITSGEIGGMIHVRDKVINKALDDLDSLAYQFSQTVNGVHREGVGMDGQGQRDFFSDLGESSKGASRRFDVSDAVAKSRESIAAGATPGSPGDNQIALQLSELQSQKFAFGNLTGAESRTFSESITGLVGRIGVEAQRENNFYRHQDSVMSQLENYRESVSGVSLEEEAINMMQYQTVFNASAKAFKVGQDLLDTIMSLKKD